MKKFTTLFMALMIAVSATMFTSCDAFMKAVNDAVTGEVVVAAYGNNIMADAFSATVSIDEVDQNGSLIQKDVVKTSVNFFNGAGTITAAKDKLKGVHYYHIMIKPNDTYDNKPCVFKKPLVSFNGLNSTDPSRFEALGKNKYTIYYDGTNIIDGTTSHVFYLTCTPITK